MDSGLGSDEEKRSRTKEQKQRLNQQQQLISGCFIDATSLGDESDAEQRRSDERRQGALVFQSSIQQFSMLQMCHSESQTSGQTDEGEAHDRTTNTYLPSTPHNSIIQVNSEHADVSRRTPVGFYVDLNEVPDIAPAPANVEKKNIFSMVIDFDVAKREMPSRLSSSLYSRRKLDSTPSTRSTENLNNSGQNSGTSGIATSTTCSSDVEDHKNGRAESVSAHESPRSHSERNREKCEAILIKITRRSDSTESISNGKSSSVTTGSSDHQFDSDEGASAELLINEQNQESSCEEQLISPEVSQAFSLKTFDDSLSQQGPDEASTSKDDNTSDDKVSSKCQFVKLSDLEKQSPQIDLTLVPRMSRSIPESSWVESPLAMSRSTGYRSAPRPLEPEPSELSDSGSFTDMSISQPRRSVQRLGTDLLRMFLEEIGPDVTIEVGSRKLRAHKCILSSRCQYFAAMLGGNWLEASGNVISLQGYSYAAVHFALCHIYSGAAHVPDSISLVELASLADMLGLEGLKEVVAHSLKVRHCHSFHKPCTGCCTGVVEVLPLAAAYGLDELYQKCLRWITQHFVRVWPTRAFAILPRELRDKCYQQHVVHMSPDTVLEITLSCERLLAVMPTARWAEPVAHLAVQLADACQLYLRQHYSSVLASPSFLVLDSQLVWNIGRVEDDILTAAGALEAEQACRSYGRCHKMLQQSWSTSFLDLLHKIHVQLEQCVGRQVTRASHSKAWTQLDPILRTRIRELSRLTVARVRRSDIPTPRYDRQNSAPRSKPISSSDSSRNSSPAASSSNQLQTRSTGSPSLRRSLLLAARAPQIPPSSPSTNRRTSTLTKPTQSSAAKSNIPKQVNRDKSIPVKVTTVTKPVTTTSKPPSTKKLIKQEPKKVPKLSKVTEQRLLAQRKFPAKPAVVESKIIPKKLNIPPKKNVTVSTNATKGSSKTLPVGKASDKSGKTLTRSKDADDDKTQKPVCIMQRSETFLKEEPTVLGKVQ